MNSRTARTSSIALKVLRVIILFAFLLLAGFVVFCLALSAQAAPASKVIRLARPVVKQNQIVIKIGHSYRAERLHPQPPAPSFLYYHGIYLTWRNSVHSNRIKKITR